MKLGAFSISLAVKDLAASRAFYEALGFQPHGPEPEGNYVILKNGDAIVGLFQGMFDDNILTFNPGWDQHARPIPEFDDVRVLQTQLEEAGFSFVTKADPASTGPANFVVIDPDGNPILVDQHVPRPPPS